MHRRFDPLAAVAVAVSLALAVAGCAGPERPVTVPDSEIPGMGLLELDFGGRDADLCATLRVPDDLKNMPVTLSIEPAAKVVDAGVVG